MTMPRNLEDAQLIRESTKTARAQAKREKEILDTIDYYLSKLTVALIDDFNLTQEKAAQRIKERHNELQSKAGR